MKKDETGKEDGDADELLSLLHDKNCFKADNNNNNNAAIFIVWRRKW